MSEYMLGNTKKLGAFLHVPWRKLCGSLSLYDIPGFDSLGGTGKHSNLDRVE